MTKKAFGELVLSILEKGYTATDKPTDIREIWVAADIVRSSEINKIIETLGEELAPEWVSTFKNVVVLTDADRNLKYSNLPAKILSTNGKGLWQISPMQNEAESFIQTSVGDDFVYSKLEAKTLLGQTQYWREGQRVYYHNNTYDNVLVKMLAQLIDIPDNYPIPVPDEEYLMDKVLQWFGIQNVKPETPPVA